jgi:ribosomal protein S18 acetylase RimI-like enzyme
VEKETRLHSLEKRIRPRSGGSPRIVCAQLAHLDSIVKIHMEAFQGFFLESLGERFLKELYLGFLLDRSGICLVAIDGKLVVGFVAGTSEPDGFFLRLLRSRWRAFLFAGLVALLLRPLRVGRKFFYALRYRGERPVDVPHAALLSSIGVARGDTGKGIGGTLLSSFCEEVRVRGVPVVFLTTDRDRNDAVNRLYRSNGFTWHSSFLKKPCRWMNLYTRSLLEARPAGHDSSLHKAAIR